MNFDPLSLEEIIASIFAVDDHYYLCGSPTEFNEVLSGGAFWVHPQLLKPEQARELLQGREAEAVRRGAALFAGGALRPAQPVTSAPPLVSTTPKSARPFAVVIWGERRREYFRYPTMQEAEDTCAALRKRGMDAHVEVDEAAR